MYNFIGVHECKLDAKGRLTIPSAIKKQLGDTPYFILKRAVFQPCLELYPLAEWEKIMQKLNKLNRFVKKNNDFIRAFTAGVKMIEIDGNGRLLIPKDLMQYATIKKEIVISSAVSIFEIWDKTRYENVLTDSEKDFAQWAEEVMGNFESDDV